MTDINKAVPRDWHEWANKNRWVHVGYSNGKPVLMKLPDWARPWGIGL